MIITTQFGEKEVSFNTSFAWCFIYKNQFGQDPVRILVPAIKKMSQVDSSSPTHDQDVGYGVYEALGFTGIAQIAWSMAKLSDKSILEPMTWLLSFGDDFDAEWITLNLIPEVITSCFTSKKSKAPAKTATAEEETKKPKKQ